MTEASPANLQLAIVLPLAVVANQLMRIEADLRSLNMKALVYAGERAQGGLAEQIAASLEKINDEVDLIRGLTANILSDVQRSAYPSQTDD
jgi:hypothetical protein